MAQRRSIFTAVAAVLFGLCLGMATGAGAYTFTTIDYPGAIRTYAYGINDSGQIVGSYKGSSGTHGFFYDGTSFSSIDYPGAIWTEAYDINNSGLIVGSFNRTSAVEYHGFLYDGADFTTIDVPGAGHTYAYGINDSGLIVGSYYDDGGYGFLYDGADFTTIDVGIHTYAYGINDSGLIVGYVYNDNNWGFQRLNANRYIIFSGPGAVATYAFDINDSGLIVGFYYDGSNSNVFLYDGVDFTTIDVPGAGQTHAYGINNSGLIVGFYVDSSLNYHGFLAEPDVTKSIVLETATSNDDGHSFNCGPVNWSYPNMAVGTQGYAAWSSAVRFREVPIPQGAEILSARLSLSPFTSGTMSLTAEIHAIASDSTSPLNEGDLYCDLPETVESALWDVNEPVERGVYIGGPDQAAPNDVTAIIQEIVDRTGWVEGNALTLVLTADSPYAYFCTFDYWGAPRGAELYIDYR